MKRLFQKNITNTIFFVVTIVAAVFTLCYGIYQNKREHAFRCDILHSRLQLNNYEEMLHFSDSVKYKLKRPSAEIRVTVIDTLGNVLYDTEFQDVASMNNHLEREEVQLAMAHGSGYDIKRASTANRETYFYSATRFGDKIFRSAVPYKTPLTASLEKDYTFLYYTVGILVLIAIVLFLRHRLRKSEEDKQRIKRQLTQNAAHELKTPAASISGYLETLLGNKDLDAEKRTYFLEKCYAQSQRMSRLLNDMSTLTRLDEAAIERPNTEIDAILILQGILAETQSLFDKQNIILTTSLPNQLMMSGDSALIYSMFRNIIDNTLSYAVGATSFKVSAQQRGEEIEFTFADNGVGVNAEHLPHLFERFYRVDKGRSRKLGGTGLGLAIVKNIAVQYGGTATAETTPGGGLTISITVHL